jgi:aminoacyl-tRNA hydrolase
MLTHFIRPVRRRILFRLTLLHRRRLRNVTLIGVTGSTGKTTTKELIAAVASSHLRGGKSEHLNLFESVAREIRRISPRDQFAVLEVAATGPGTLEATLALFRPQIGVVTTVASDHYSAFGSIEAIAAEKRKLVAVLPPTGIVVLNADDPRVLAMKEGFHGRALTFGLSPDATVRAEAVSAIWPERLAFTLVYEGRRVSVQTQLCGDHWVHAALAAVAVGLILGVPLEAAARSLGEVAPVTGRMCPVLLPDGVTFIRDDYKASVSTILVALTFMRQARAKRKVAILGTISDTMGDAGAVYVNIARRALEAADYVIFVGPRAFASLRAKTHADDDRIRAFSTVKAAAEFCNTFLEPGDLVLLKGSNAADHLYRIILTRTRSVACWLSDCTKKLFCDECSQLSVPSGVETQPPAVSNLDGLDALVDQAPSQVLVGLGNPGEALSKTPHNVGQLVVNRIAELLGASWTRTGGAFLACGEWHGERVCMVKLTTAMNRSGPSLRELSQLLRFGPAQCILIQDDLDLPLGTVRTRIRGSDGGHRGVRSILEAFQTDQFRRVKVGVRRAGEARRGAEAVLDSFTPEEYAVIEVACSQASERAGQLVADMRRTTGAQTM